MHYSYTAAICLASKKRLVLGVSCHVFKSYLGVGHKGRVFQEFSELDCIFFVDFYEKSFFGD